MAETRIVVHKDAAEFLDRASAWLLQAEVEHTVVLGVAARIAGAGPSAGDVLFATVLQDGAVAGCAFRTPPFKLSLTRMPAAAIAPLARVVAARYHHLPAVLGPASSALLFAEEWSRLTGAPSAPGRQQRIYTLDQVVWPDPIARGAFRVAVPDDAALIAEWVESFLQETQMPRPEVRAQVDTRIAERTLFLWEDDGPRSLSAWAATTPNTVRIGYVYTPQEWRGRGYASACVAAASQRALDAGYRCALLYTDLANPTSNAIYQHIGYRPVCDVLDYQFE